MSTAPGQVHPGPWSGAHAQLTKPGGRTRRSRAQDGPDQGYYWVCIDLAAQCSCIILELE